MGRVSRPTCSRHLGEPYVTHEGRPAREDRRRLGLGLGLFIAKTLLERSGAAVTTANSEPPSTGALYRVAGRARFSNGARGAAPLSDKGRAKRLGRRPDRTYVEALPFYAADQRTSFRRQH